MTHLSLFSGIGGLDLAAEWAGFQTVGQCEFADYPYKVLCKHWPDVPKWRDIRTLTKEDFYARTGRKTVDLISGGFPCQPHSVIGKRLAERDDRHLWPEFMRIVQEFKPRYVVGENVNGILSTIHESVCSDLEKEGYKVRTYSIPAVAVGVQEFKPRYVVGENVNGILSTIHESVCSDLEKEGYKVRTYSIPAVAVGAHHERYRVCILGISQSQSGFQTNSEFNPIRKDREARENTECKFGVGISKNYWTVHKPPLCGMADGIPDWMGGYQQYKERMMCYGNAVVPQQFYPVFQAIAEVMKGA